MAHPQESSTSQHRKAGGETNNAFRSQMAHYNGVDLWRNLGEDHLQSKGVKHKGKAQYDLFKRHFTYFDLVGKAQMLLIK